MKYRLFDRLLSFILKNTFIKSEYRELLVEKCLLIHINRIYLDCQRIF